MNCLERSEGFLALEQDEYCELERSKTVVQTIPFEKTSSYLQGSCKGPNAIIEASHYVEYFDEELQSESFRKTGIATVSPIACEDRDVEDLFLEIENQTLHLLEADKFVVTLGGEHTISYPVFKAVNKVYLDSVSVLQLDAHSDLREDYHNDKFSHACVMKRIADLNVPIVQVGIRALCKEEFSFMQSHSNIKTFFNHDIQNKPDWIQSVVDSLSDMVYITIDTDGFDPSVMLATGTPEPGGLTWWQGVSLLREVFKQKKVVAFDVVECCPSSENSITEYNLAKLVYKLIGYKFNNSKNIF